MSETYSQRLENMFCFAKDVLGYGKLTELHVSWFDALLKHRFILLLAPPRHYKSTVCTITYPLFRLTEDHNMRILIVNETLDTAKLFLGEIKSHLRDNPKFRSRYGEWNVMADAWTEDRILIPRTVIRKEPSIACASVLGTIVSIHPNLIILDDPCSNRNTLTPSQRLKIINWFQRDLLPRLDNGGQIVVVMTRWHTDDLAGWIMNNVGYNDWAVISLAAERYDEQGNHHILFPEVFSKEELEREKARLGTANYNCVYLSDPSGQEGTDFKASWIDSGRYDKLPERLKVVAAVDPAISQKDKACDFAYSVVGKDKEGTVFVLDAFKGSLDIVAQLNAVKRLNRIHSPEIIVIESNGYQASFAQMVKNEPEIKAKIVELNNREDKHARIRTLAPQFERGQIRLPRRGDGWVEQLEYQLLHFPNTKDDMLDALWMAVGGVKDPKRTPAIWYTDDFGYEGYYRRRGAMPAAGWR